MIGSVTYIQYCTYNTCLMSALGSMLRVVLRSIGSVAGAIPKETKVKKIESCHHKFFGDACKQTDVMCLDIRGCGWNRDSCVCHSIHFISRAVHMRQQ